MVTGCPAPKAFVSSDPVPGEQRQRRQSFDRSTHSFELNRQSQRATEFPNMSSFGSTPFDSTDPMGEFSIFEAEDNIDWTEGYFSTSFSGSNFLSTLPNIDLDGPDFGTGIHSFTSPDNLAPRDPVPLSEFEEELMSSQNPFNEPLGDIDEEVDDVFSSPFPVSNPDLHVPDHEVDLAAEYAEAGPTDEDLIPEPGVFESFSPKPDLEYGPSGSERAPSEAGDVSSESDNDSDSDFEPDDSHHSSRLRTNRQSANTANGSFHCGRDPDRVFDDAAQREASTLGGHGNKDGPRARSTVGGKSISYTNKLLGNKPVTPSVGGKCTTTLLKRLISDVLADSLCDSEKLSRISQLVRDADAADEPLSDEDSDLELDNTPTPCPTPRRYPTARKAPPPPSAPPSSAPARKKHSAEPSNTKLFTPPLTPGRSQGRTARKSTTTPSHSPTSTWTSPSKPASLRTSTGRAPQIRWQEDEAALIRRTLPKIVLAGGITGEDRFARVADILNEKFGERYERQHGVGAGRTMSSVKNYVQRNVRAQDAAEGVEFDDRMPRKDGKKREVVTSVRANKKRARNDGDDDDDDAEDAVRVKRQKKVAGDHAGAAMRKVEDEEDELEEGEIREAPVPAASRAGSKSSKSSKKGGGSTAGKKKRTEAERMHARAVYKGDWP